MACLIKDALTGEILGYKNFTKAQREKINAEGNVKVTPFYDTETCKAVMENLERR